MSRSPSAPVAEATSNHRDVAGCDAMIPSRSTTYSESARRSNSSLSATRVWPWDRWLVRSLLQSAGNPPVVVRLWNGEQIRTAAQSPRAVITLPDRVTLWRLCWSPSMTLGDEYAAGRIQVDGDLVEFCRTIEQALAALPTKPFARRSRPNTLARSRDNVYHHYDLGNDFYRLWLDQELAYTCAYFRTPETSLEQAQRDKFDHVCRKLRLAPGQTVVEAGCGWGGLALHMARNYGVPVTAYNVSREQIAFARQRAATEGLDRQVQFIEADWRTIEGRFDAFVSVGMLEHVGPENYRELGQVIQRSLKSDGLGLIHTIGRNSSRPVDAWAERRIFPGSFVPTLAEMMGILEAGSFSVLDVENLRLHYARTVEHWLDRFDRHVATIRDMFGERFVRMWRLYLAASIATFEGGNMQLFQVVFAHSRNNQIPQTREHIYQRESRLYIARGRD